jgi:2-aminoadipate transaminase
MEQTLARPQLISLAAGFTDSDSLPVKEAGVLLGEIFADRKLVRTALQYGTTSGDLMLRQLTAERCRILDGKKGFAGGIYRAEHILITSGSQQLLYLVTECLCDPEDIVLVEDPTYFVYLGIARSHRLRCRGIRLAEDGVDPGHLERVLEALRKSGDLHRVKMLYLVSYHQNPTTITTSFKKKIAALELLRRYERAAGHPIYLLEDAAYRELQFAGAEVPSALTARHSSNRVIYAGTFSKPFATGVRVGFGWLPQELLAVIKKLKSNHDFGTSNFLQQLVKRALASGKYDSHLVALHNRYAQKARLMIEALEEHFPKEARWRTPEGGLYVWVRLPKSLKSGRKSKLFQAALSHDVLYVPGELCYAPDATRQRPNHEMRLSFGGASEADIRIGIARLGEILRSLF